MIPSCFFECQSDDNFISVLLPTWDHGGYTTYQILFWSNTSKKRLSDAHESDLANNVFVWSCVIVMETSRYRASRAICAFESIDLYGM